MRIDLHTHSTVSDGTDSPTELVQGGGPGGAGRGGTDRSRRVRRVGRGGGRRRRGRRVGLPRHGTVLLAPGTERAPAGLRGRSEAPGLAAEMQRVRGGRTARLLPVLDKLAELGVGVTEEEVLVQVGESPSVGRPHIADAMVAAGHVRDRTEAFDRYLADGGPAHVPRYAIEIGRGIDLVHAAGGVAVIAHPWGRGRERLLPAPGPEPVGRRARSGRDRGRPPRSRRRGPGPTALPGR